MIKWIVALIIGLSSSVFLMSFLVFGIVENPEGASSGDLVFKSFFDITGGTFFLEKASDSVFVFAGATLYYLLFFTLVGLLVGFIIEWLISIIRTDSE